MLGMELIFQKLPAENGSTTQVKTAETGSARPAGQSGPLLVQETNPRCVFAGEGTLMQQCLQIWKDKGLLVDYVLSPDPAVQTFARQQGIPLLHSWEGLDETLSQSPVHYLFSIGNHQIIKSNVLQHLWEGAVNCHYGPLPKYAGIHSPSWAILNSETRYGITWHQITTQIDTGNILIQKETDIAPDETAMTLDAKCYEAALAGFTELLDRILDGKLQPVVQDISQRSYFSLKDRPARGGIIDWYQPAVETDRLFRALNFGPYLNTLGVPKIYHNARLLIPVGLRMLQKPSALPPGTITEIREDSIHISTSTSDIALTGVTTLQGKTLSPVDLQTQMGWQAGMQFPVLTASEVAGLEKRDAALAPFQNYWARKLTDMQPAGLPYASRLPLKEGKTEGYPVLVKPGEVSAPDLSAMSGGDYSFPALLCAALMVYLHRITNARDIYVGFSTGEQYPEDQEQEPIPFFAPVVPFGIAGIDPDDGFEGVYQAARQELNMVCKRQTYPLDLLVRYPGLRSRHELQADPAFQINLLITDTLITLPAALPGVLTLIIAEKENRYAWAGNPERLDMDSMNRIACQFSTMLQDLTRSTATPVKHLKLLSDAECQKVIVDWNQTAVPYDQTACMHHLFEQQVMKTPLATAARLGDQTLTYLQLNQKANQLAHRLRKSGVGPDVLVGICMEKTFEMIIGVLGIQKAGGAYVPLDPKAPVDRQAVVLDDLKLSVLVTQPHLTARFTGFDFETVALDSDGASIAGEPVTRPESLVTADNLAYIIYTSGSTGIPKGVVVRHRPAINLIEWVNKTFSVGPADCLLFVNSLGFDLSVYDIFGILAAGGIVRIASAEELSDPQRLLQVLHEEPITFWNSAPATLSQMVPFGSMGQVKPDTKTHLRLAFLSGDWIPLTMPDWIRDTFPGTQVISLGGATEGTVWSNYYPIGELQEQWVSIPYGKPIQNARYHILNACLQPVPPGVSGDLYIGGDCLADGYLNRPELNAEKFIPDPFSPRLGDRLYRTGDLARYFPDGNIEFLGRVDHQVKIRGYRIEPGEIEAVLSSRKDLQEVMVMAGPDPAGGKRLIAYMVAKPDSAPETAEVRNYLRSKLPEYMIPAAFVWLKGFPLNASGKVDRKALPEPHNFNEVPDHYTAPRNNSEKLLSQVWQQEMGIGKISTDTNFFEIGGHSLMAGKIISRIHQITGQRLPLSSIFANPTIAGLARLLENYASDQVWSTLVAVRDTGNKPPLFCIHPISGDVEYVYKLADYLDEDQPVYGIIARGMNGEDKPFESVEEAAGSYLQEILKKCPQGPYNLGGYSYGGYVAYEIAVQLTKMGHQVENLFLYDTYPTYNNRKNFVFSYRYVLLSHFLFFLSFSNITCFLRKQYWRGVYILRRKRSSVKRLAQLFGFYSRKQKLPFADNDSEESSSISCSNLLMRVLDKALVNYKTPSYAGKVVFFRAVEGAARYISRSDFGWKRKISGEFVICDIAEADHYTLFKENTTVREIAGEMRLHLRQAPEKSRKQA